MTSDPPPPPSPATPAREWLHGVRDTVPMLVGAAPFGLIFGTLAAGSGLSGAGAMAMSAFVFAGSAQFIALDTWAMPPAWLAIGIATFVVNARHIFMSASILRHMQAFPAWMKPPAMVFLADEIWAFAEARAARQRLTPAYYAGLVSLFYLNYVASTVAGAYAGRLMRDPKAYGFDFAFIAIFIGLILGFRQRSGFAWIVAASALAATAVHLIYPGPQSIAAGALAGIVVAALLAKPEQEGEPA